MLSAYGMTVADLMNQIDLAFAGEKAGEIFEGQQYFDLVVRFKETARDSKEAIESALISLPKGGKIPLNQLAEVAPVSSPNPISRENVQRKTVVSANVQGRDLRRVVNEIKRIVESNTPLPDGYRVEHGGQFDSEEKYSSLILI